MQNNEIQKPNSEPSADNGTKPHVSGCTAHKWDKVDGKWEPGRPHIGIKGTYVRTCTECGYKEYFSRGMYSGWFSVR